METKKSYQDKTEKVLRDWGKKIDELKARADQSKSEMKVKYYELIEGLRKKQESAGARLKELKESGEDRWEKLKDRIEDAIHDLKNAFDRTASKFR